MKRALLFDVLKLAIIFGALWAAFTFISFPKFEPDALELSVDNEEKLGKLIVDEMLLNNPEVRIDTNKRLDSAIKIITNRLVNKIGVTDYQYNIRVIEGPEINAFTLPGGNIFIYSGLIEFSNSPEEVAAVVAHEIGHAEKKHVIQRLIKELGINILFSALTGGDAVILSGLSKTAASTVFDRKQEKEADEYSFSLMEKAGINPVSLAFFFKRLNNINKSENDFDFLSTHPNNNSRIKASLEYKTLPGFKSETFNLNWKAVKAANQTNKHLNKVEAFH